MAKAELSKQEQRQQAIEKENRRLTVALKRTKRGKTAADLGTTAVRLRQVEGVIEIGRVKTGKAGRPAIIFGLEGVHEPQVEESAPAEPEASEPESQDDGGSEE